MEPMSGAELDVQTTQDDVILKEWRKPQCCILKGRKPHGFRLKGRKPLYCMNKNLISL